MFLTKTEFLLLTGQINDITKMGVCGAAAGVNLFTATGDPRGDPPRSRAYILYYTASLVLMGCKFLYY